MTATAPAPTRHANDGVTFLPLRELRPSKTNPRRMVDKKADAELVESIKTHGIAQPLLVRVVGSENGDERWEVVAGARRLRCAKEAGLLEVPCFVREMTDAQALELQLIENTHRKDVHPLDEGVAFREMIEQHGYTAEALAEKVGRSERWVYGRMALAKLPPAAQALYVEGQLDLSLAQLLTTVPEEFQEKAAKAFLEESLDSLDGRMSFREAKDFVAREYHCTLADAPFPTEKKDLLPDMGACSVCPHATNNQHGLFDQVVEQKGDKKKPALCTMPSCYTKKTRAAFEMRAAAVEAAGGTVLRGAAAAKASGTKLDEPCYLDEKHRTWRQLLGKHLPLAEVTLVEPVKRSGARTAEPEERIAPKALREALKKAGHGRLAPKPAPKHSEPAAKSETSDAARDRWKREAEARDRRIAQMRRALVSGLDAIGKVDEATAWALVLRYELARDLEAESHKELTVRIGFDVDKKPELLLELDAETLRRTALQVLVLRDDCWMSRFEDSTQAIAKACGVDLKKALADVVAADKAEAKQKAKAETKPAAKPAKTKGAKKKPKR